MSKYGNIREEELKNKVAHDFFASYDTTRIIGNIDFCVSVPQPDGPELFEQESLLWAEAKKGDNSDLIASFAQLIITIGKARTHDSYLPPIFLGAFDAKRIAFVPFAEVMHLFSQNDFNWNVTPSDHQTSEFKQLQELLGELEISKKLLLYDFASEERLLHAFIKDNFHTGDGRIRCIQITINNFVNIYLRWLNEVKPSIAVDWELAKKKGILDADFFLADLLSERNLTLKQKLYVLLRGSYYVLDRTLDDSGLWREAQAYFHDDQQAHQQFWNKYVRPPRREFWDAIVGRRDLLVPQDVRERKGSFFTPRQWVELSQQYLADELGDKWQEEYYIWDCAAGTGNLLAGLTNKYHIYASTLDQADVDVMNERIDSGANLLNRHVFQFDFLNDPFKDLPESLRDIINDPDKRKKLVVYINPPYAEAATTRTKTGTGASKAKVARDNQVFLKYGKEMGLAGNELFAQFFIRIFKEMPGCVIGEFSTLKLLLAPGSQKFRQLFTARLCRMALLPADTFDNVKGQFPIGFKIWRTDEAQPFQDIVADVYNREGNKIGEKTCKAPPEKLLMDWHRTNYDKKSRRIAYMRMLGSDIQHSGDIFLTLTPYANDIKQRKICNVTENNLCSMTVYLSVRLCIERTWLNDRDQFLYPNDDWHLDKEFHGDCLAYALFHGQNRISCAGGVNHWIPFTEVEVEANESFTSHFMSDYIQGKHMPTTERTLFDQAEPAAQPVQFSAEAQAVMHAGRELWRYYHQQPSALPNAAFYDIRLFFQGQDAKGHMNATSTDNKYNQLISSLRTALKELAQKKIQPKVYQYGFLRE